MRLLFAATLLVILPIVTSATIIHVPADEPTIQAGVDSASTGDTVLIADGTYTGSGNRDIDLRGKAIVVRSVSGQQSTAIDCQGSAGDPHIAFVLISGEDSTTIIEGITITGAYKDSDIFGYNAAIECLNSSLTLKNCRIASNQCGALLVEHGPTAVVIDSCLILENSTIGAIMTRYTPVTMKRCLVSGSTRHGALLYAGKPFIISQSIFANNAWDGLNATHNLSIGHEISVSNCTFVNNENGFQYSIDISKSPTVRSSSEEQTTSVISNNVAAYNRSWGLKLWCSFDYDVVCNLSYDNQIGDFWIDTYGQHLVSGNLALDPLFCDTTDGDYAIDSLSPCSPLSPLNSSLELIGASDATCRMHADQDNDSIPDLVDNCPSVANTDQADLNGNGQGDVCDGYCCYVRGNVNRSPDEAIDITDLTFLVAYAFKGGPTPPCLREADINGSSVVDIADVTFLVRYMFNGGLAPVLCDIGL